MQSSSVNGLQTAEAFSRDRPLDTALALFASRGYATTSTAEIQKACGISPGSGALYRRSRNKSEVLGVPGDMDPERFRNAWLRLSRSVFTHGVPD